VLEEGEIAEETPNVEGSITPLDRHQRHGHHPAIILVNTRPALARQLERALFQAEFEVMVVERNASFISPRTAWATLHEAGFVVLYQNPSPGIEERVDMLAAAGDYFFDLAELDLPVVDAEAVEQIVVLAESLRIPTGAKNPWEVA
jgi:hypothetical protein